MRSSRLRCTVAVLAALCATACDAPSPVDAGGGVDARRDYTPEPFEPTEATRAYCPIDDDAVEARITALLAELSIDDKARLMAGESLALVEGSWRVPGNERLGLPGFRMLDGPRGLSRFSGKRGTAFPVAMMRGATFDPELERRVGAAMARETLSAGADVLLAPTVNVLRHPRWGRAQETYGEDTHHMGEMGVAFVRGVQGEGVIASAKHFALNSIEDTRHEVNVLVDERTLREVYLPHFERLVREAQVGSVMSAYNQVNGDYCDRSAHLLREILKEEWGFAGFVESDWVFGTHGHAESVRAGLDIEMPLPTNFRQLPRAVANGELSEAELDRSVRRILRAQLCYGLDTRARTLDDASERETPEHLALAREAATRGAVLLENRDAGGAPALPLSTPLRVVVLGRLADVENIGDEGSSSVRPSDVVTALEGIRALAPSAEHLAGATLDAAGEASVAAADAVIVVTGLTGEDEGEDTLSGGDRETLELPAEELALIAAVAARSERVIVVLEGGAAITVEPFVDDVEAIVHAFYPGAQGGLALADLLFGVEAFAGRLPFSVPRREADLPAFDNTSLEVTYGFLHGYRHLQAEATPPRYAFGHGLTYTTFAYEALRLDGSELATSGELRVEVDVRNTGGRAARALVQIYVGVEGSRVPRAPRDLRAFGAVTLAPDQLETVRLSVRVRDLAFYDVDAGGWELEALTYRVEAGASAENLPLAELIALE